MPSPITGEDEAPCSQSERGRFRVTGTTTQVVKLLVGPAVIAVGFNKVRDELELTHLVERKPNTPELR